MIKDFYGKQLLLRKITLSVKIKVQVKKRKNIKRNKIGDKNVMMDIKQYGSKSKIIKGNKKNEKKLKEV